MHILKILEAMGEGVGLEERSALAGSLGAYVRDNKIFSRPAPNTFGLLEFKPALPQTEEPPTGFGGDDNNEWDSEDIPF